MGFLADLFAKNPEAVAARQAGRSARTAARQDARVLTQESRTQNIGAITDTITSGLDSAAEVGVAYFGGSTAPDGRSTDLGGGSRTVDIPVIGQVDTQAALLGAVAILFILSR